MNIKVKCNCNSFKIMQVTNFEGLNGNFEDTCDIEPNLACSSSPHPRAGFSPSKQLFECNLKIKGNKGILQPMHVISANEHSMQRKIKECN